MEKLPETMTTIAISSPGGPEVLVPETRAVPAPKAGEVLIRVHAAGVNRPDIMQRARAEVDVRRLMMKRLRHTGSTPRPRSVAFKARIAETLHERVWPLFEARRIAPIIGSTYPLARAADAHARMDAGDHVGRIVLTVGDG